MANRRPIIAGIQMHPEEDRDPLAGEFREAMSRFPAGVAVIASRDEDEVAAVTVSSFTSLSIDPPLVLVCLGLDTPVLPFIRETERFTVNILGRSAHAAASRFSQRMPEDLTLFRPASAVLHGATASMACALAAEHPGGDHRIVIGRVERVELGREEPPLIYHARSYIKLD